MGRKGVALPSPDAKILGDGGHSARKISGCQRNATMLGAVPCPASIPSEDADGDRGTPYRGKFSGWVIKSVGPPTPFIL